MAASGVLIGVMNWALYAVLSAVFGALVAIFGKIGVRDVDSKLGVALRTVIIVCFAYEMDEMRNGTA